MLGGQLSVDQPGAASYAIPIQVPPGIANPKCLFDCPWPTYTWPALRLTSGRIATFQLDEQWSCNQPASSDTTQRIDALNAWKVLLIVRDDDAAMGFGHRGDDRVERAS